MLRKVELANSRPLTDLKSAHTLRFFGMPPFICEKKVASLRSKTITCLLENDVRAVSYRYAKNNIEEKSGILDILIRGCLFILWHAANKDNFLDFDSQEEDFSLNLNVIVGHVFFILIVLLLIVAISNTYRYYETNEFCRKWLKQYLNEQNINKLRSASYSDNCFFAIDKILDDNKIAPATIKNLPGACSSHIV